MVKEFNSDEYMFKKISPREADDEDNDEGDNDSEEASSEMYVDDELNDDTD